MKKLVPIMAWLMEDPEAYKGKTNVDIEKMILEKMSLIPYVAEIEKSPFWMHVRMNYPHILASTPASFEFTN